jgi:zinc protease
LALPDEPCQTGIREISEEAPIELGYAHFAWHVPDLRHPDMPAIEALAALLGNGRTSRLYRNVREAKGLVHSVNSWTCCPGGQGLFGVSATMDVGNLEQAREAILDEIERLRTGMIPASEIAKVVKQSISCALASRKTMQGQAQDLGSNWLTTSDLSFSERFLEAVKQVTPEMLLRVARDYIQPARRTAFALLPNGSVAGNVESQPKTGDQAVRKIELDNGLRLLLKEDHRLPFVEMRAVFTGGVLHERPAKNGVTQLMGKMLIKGASDRSAEDIARAIEEVGGSIDTYGGNNSFGANVEVLGADFALGLDVLADVLLRPTFPAREFEREREVQLACVRSQKDDLLHRAFQGMRNRLFAGCGYGMDPSGSEDSLKSLAAPDLAALHKQKAAPRNCVLSIFGDISPETAIEAVKGAFGGWTSQAPEPLAPGASQPPAASQRVVEQADKKQAVVVIGFPGLTFKDTRRYALELLQEACSDLGSRLFLRIREELGLAYYVGAQNFLGLEPGYFAFYAGTMPEKAAVVEAELKKEAALLQTDGLTDAELARAKAKVLGQRKIARQDLGHQAASASLDEIYGLGYNYSEKEDALYEAVTPGDIKEVACAALALEHCIVSLAGPLDPQT